MCCANILDLSVLLPTVTKPIFLLPRQKVKSVLIGETVLESSFGECSRFNSSNALFLVLVGIVWLLMNYQNNHVVKQPPFFLSTPV